MRIKQSFYKSTTDLQNAITTTNSGKSEKLFKATTDGDLKRVTDSLSENVSRYARDPQMSNTALHMAVKSGKKRIVEKLLENCHSPTSIFLTASSRISLKFCVQKVRRRELKRKISLLSRRRWS